MHCTPPPSHRIGLTHKARCTQSTGLPVHSVQHLKTCSHCYCRKGNIEIDTQGMLYTVYRDYQIHTSFEQKNSVNLILHRFWEWFEYYWPQLISPTKIFCPNTFSLCAIYDSSKSKVLKTVKMKNKRNLINKQERLKMLFSLLRCWPSLLQ